jgi:large subunit ribosomal protein L1
MDHKTVLEAVRKAKADTKKRTFVQSIDLIINLKDLDLKKPEQQLDLYATITHGIGKKRRIAAFVGPEMKEEAAKVVDTIIMPEDFPKYADKKLAKKLANTHSYFLAQANLMAQVAGTFGKILGTRGKMPNPKAGCVVPPKANLRPLVEKLQNTLRLKARTQPMVQCIVGREDMDEDQVADNILNIYNQVIHALPHHEQNVGKTIVKLTMGKIVEIK